MKAIVAVDANWGIGYKGNLLANIPEDMKFFKQMTLGKVVVMGRETLESLPGKKPLTNRTNIILTRNKDFSCEGAIICYSTEELFEEIKKYQSEDIFIIGGESVYKQMLPYCSEIYVTRIKRQYTADKYFENLDKNSSWTEKSVSETKEWNDIEFEFVKYANNNTIEQK